MAILAAKLDFLETFKEVADLVCPEYGVSPQVCVSQAVLETGWGWARSRRKQGLTLEAMFAQRGYNFFGLKGKGDAGSQYWKTKEHRGAPKDGVKIETITAKFAKFSSLEAGVRGYCIKLTNRRYKGASETFSDDPGRYITYVWGQGYATAGSYATRVMGVMRSVAKITGDESYNVSPDEGLQAVIDRFRTVPAGRKRRKILADELKTRFQAPVPTIHLELEDEPIAEDTEDAETAPADPEDSSTMLEAPTVVDTEDVVPAPDPKPEPEVVPESEDVPDDGAEVAVPADKENHEGEVEPHDVSDVLWYEKLMAILRDLVRQLS